MNFPEKYKHHGGCTELAKSLGIRRPIVYDWKKRNMIPHNYRKQVSILLHCTEPEPEPQPEQQLTVKLSELLGMVASYLEVRGL